jgi:lipopolysaccharide/colanic/teichoic acid biosynthesis glycosyltransferase
MWHPRRFWAKSKLGKNGHSKAYSGPPVASEETFLAVLGLERKRTERSRRSFVLMLLEYGENNPCEIAERVFNALSVKVRETDVCGWYKDQSVIGVIFTEVGAAGEGKAIARVLSRKVNSILAETLTTEQMEHVGLSFHVFPDDPDEAGPLGGAGSALYADLATEVQSKTISRTLKRALDIAGSLLALVFLAPVFILIAVAIRVSSPAPVLFRQTRLGENGAPFTFLKFRSMHAANDSSAHQAYVTQLIAGAKGCDNQAQGGAPVYKLTGDPRVTPIGRFLRRTSLDELPQFLNVLAGEMSLVGPRPPIPYEFACYDIWHRRRLLQVKPGITGIWQVEGRSRVKFDDMVRMDIAYARSWTVLGDIRILLKTPRAVVWGAGAH